MSAETSSAPGSGWRDGGAFGVDGVDLVQDELGGKLGPADLPEHGLDGGDGVVQVFVRGGRVCHVQDEVGRQRLLESGGEALDELVREAPDEADRVGDEVAAALVGEASRGRVEGLEQPVVDGHRRP